MAWPGDAAGRGHMRASHADRERAVDTLKAAFAQGWLTKDEFDARIGQTLAGGRVRTRNWPRSPPAFPPGGRKRRRRVRRPGGG